MRWFRRLNPLDSQLWAAVDERDVESIQRALRAGANPNCIKWGDTVLGFAGRDPKGTAEVVKALLDGGANPNGPSGKFQFLAPLVHASHSSDEARIRLIIEAGAELNLTCANSLGKTPLQEVTVWATTDFVEWMIERGADMSLKSRHHGFSALHIAAVTGNLATVKMMLRHGADAQWTDEMGHKPLDLAQEQFNQPCYSLDSMQGESQNLRQVIEFLTEITH